MMDLCVPGTSMTAQRATARTFDYRNVDSLNPSFSLSTSLDNDVASTNVNFSLYNFAFSSLLYLYIKYIHDILPILFHLHGVLITEVVYH